MEDPENVAGSSTKGSDDVKHVKHILDSTEIKELGTQPPPSAVHWTRRVSQKLSTWGVESRGATHAFPGKSDRPSETYLRAG